MNPVWHFLNGVPTGGVIAPSLVLASDGTAAAPSYGFASETGLGFFRAGTDAIGIAPDGNERYRFTSAGMQINSSETLSWGGIGSPDTVLGRGAANLLDLASGDSFRLVSGVLYGGGVVSPKMTVTSDNTAGAITYTAASLVGGLILRDCNGAGRADLVPTAANLLAAMPSAQVGQGFRFTIRNTSGTAVSITVTTNTGVTLSGTMTITQSNSKDFYAVFTNVTAASEAYTLYSLGTVVF